LAIPRFDDPVLNNSVIFSLCSAAEGGLPWGFPYFRACAMPQVRFSRLSTDSAPIAPLFSFKFVSQVWSNFAVTCFCALSGRPGALFCRFRSAERAGSADFSLQTALTLPENRLSLG
jgi:hypothetical protein